MNGNESVFREVREVLESLDSIENRSPDSLGSDAWDFSVVLKSPGPNKIEVMRVVRELTQLRLPEVRALVEGAPEFVVKRVRRDEAEFVRVRLEQAGAQVHIL